MESKRAKQSPNAANRFVLSTHLTATLRDLQHAACCSCHHSMTLLQSSCIGTYIMPGFCKSLMELWNCVCKPHHGIHGMSEHLRVVPFCLVFARSCLHMQGTTRFFLRICLYLIEFFGGHFKHWSAYGGAHATLRRHDTINSS